MELTLIVLFVLILSFIAALFVPTIRKIIGTLLIIFGILGTATVIGAFLGVPMIIVGVILVFIGSDSPKVIIQNANLPQSNDNYGRVECPFCAELIKPKATICPFCRKELPKKVLKVNLTCPNCNKEISDGNVKCPFCKVDLFLCSDCNAYVKENDLICKNCGGTLEEDEQKNISKQSITPEKQKELRIILIILILFLSGVLIIAITVMLKRNSTNSDVTILNEASSTYNYKTKLTTSSQQHKLNLKSVTNLVKPYYSSETASLIGASIDNYNELHITLVLNEKSYGWSIAAVQMLGSTKTIEELRFENALKCIFKPARNVFKRVPEAIAMNVYIATYEASRDSYGNKLTDVQSVHCKLHLTKNTMEKLEWKYINTLIDNYKKNEELKTYLDAYTFPTDYFGS